MKTTIIFFIAILLTTSSIAYTSEIKIAGGAAPMNNVFKRIKNAFEKKTGHTLVLIEQSPELALLALSKGSVDIASAGLSWQDWLKLCDDKNIKISDDKDYRHSSIGKDRIHVFVNKKSSINILNIQELEKIFSGKSVNWKEFSGVDKPINIIISPNMAGTNDFFQKTIMKGNAFRKDTVFANNAIDIAKIIEKDPYAIGFGPSGIDPKNFGIKAIDTPKMNRPIFFVFLSADQKIKDLKNFISSPEGQELIKR